MSMDFTQHTPVSEALGSSFRDLGGAGQEPFNLRQGLALNGMSQSSGPAPQSQDKGFDALLKGPATIEAPSIKTPKIEPPAVKPPMVPNSAPRKPGG